MITMEDETEAARRMMIATGAPAAHLAAEQGERWTTAKALELFTFETFSAPFVVVTRKSDGARGTIEFARGDDGERYYFGFEDA